MRGIGVPIFEYAKGQNMLRNFETSQSQSQSQCLTATMTFQNFLTKPLHKTYHYHLITKVHDFWLGFFCYCQLHAVHNCVDSLLFGESPLSMCQNSSIAGSFSLASHFVATRIIGTQGNLSRSSGQIIVSTSLKEVKSVAE